MLRKSIMLMAFCAGSAFADPGLDAVRELGHLNGEALACKQMVLVDRIRMRIIYGAPKTREVGEVFEAATTERFLAMGGNNGNQAACTDARTMAERIEQITRTMHDAFKEAMGRKP